MFRTRYLSNCLVGVYFIALLWHFYISNIVILVFVIGLFSVISLVNKLDARNGLHISILVVLIVLSLVLGYVKGYYTNTPLLLIPSYFIAVHLHQKHIYKNFFLFFYYSFLVVFLYRYFIDGLQMESILVQSSRNYISAIPFILLSTHYIYNIFKENQVSIIHALVLIIIAFIAVGRAGIITSALLFFLIFIHEYKIKWLTLGLAVIIGLLIIFYDEITSHLFTTNAYLRLNKEGLESAGRIVLLSSYFEKINLFTVFTGVSLDQYPFSAFNHNPHNSLLNAHSLFGIFSFSLIYIFFLILRKVNLISLIFGVVLMRALTDTLLFVGVFDFIWISVWLISTSDTTSNPHIYADK